MIEYLRVFLIWLRKENNNKDLKPLFLIRLILIFVFSSVLGILIDKFIPFNFIINLLRGVVAHIIGISMFSISYLIYTKYKNIKSKDKTYISLRKRLSHNQRVNLSILLGALLFVFMVLGGKPTLLYTFKAAVSICAIIVLLTFSRSSRNEFLKEVHDIPDIRDLKFKKKIKKK